jgi:hypothetical protein
MRQDAGDETDFYEWTQSQAAKLREAGSRRLNLDVDWENVAEEIESSGGEALDLLETSPSLRGRLAAALGTAYIRAARLAAAGVAEDGIDAQALPPDCPYSLAQLLEPDWFPRNRHGLE